MKARPSQTLGEVTLELNYGDETLLAQAACVTSRSPLAVKNILVPVDFSDCCRKALQYAVPLAYFHKSVITLLYVADPGYSGGIYGGVDYAYLERGLREESEKRLVTLANEQIPRDIPSETLVRMGSATEEIVEAANQLPADLIVISTHGHTGLKHVFLGSVAEHVVQRAPCPVLVVREHERDILAA